MKEENDELEEFKETLNENEKVIMKCKQDAQFILTKYFKPLHVSTGEKWTEENDKDMVHLVNVIIDAAVSESSAYTSKLLVKLEKDEI